MENFKSTRFVITALSLIILGIELGIGKLDSTQFLIPFISIAGTFLGVKTYSDTKGQAGGQ